MSGSFSSPSVAVSCEMTFLYSRKLSTSGWSSAAVLACARNFAVSPCTLGSAISVISRSYCASTALNLSNISKGSGLRAQGSGLRAQGLGLRVLRRRRPAAEMPPHPRHSTASSCARNPRSPRMIRRGCNHRAPGTLRPESPTPRGRSIHQAASVGFQMRRPFPAGGRTTVSLRALRECHPARIFVHRIGGRSFNPDFASLEMFVLPDGCDLFDALYCIPARGEGRGAVRRRCRDDDAGFAHVEAPDPVMNRQANRRPAFASFFVDPDERLHRQWLIRFVVEP